MANLFAGIDHPAIACRDVQAQIDWYCATLEMRLIASDGCTPPVGALVGYGQSTALELMLARQDGAAPETFARFQPGLRHLALRVNNFAAAVERLKIAGVKFISEPAQAVGGGKVVSFRDPEGNELQIVDRTGEAQ